MGIRITNTLGGGSFKVRNQGSGGTFKSTAVTGSVAPTPSVNTWTRPTDWLTMPTPGVQEVIGLMAVYDDDANYVAFQCQGAYTVDWGDGTVTNYTSNAVASYQHTFASLPSGTLTSKGFRQALVRITPQGGSNLTSVAFNVLHPTLGKYFSVGWLDFDIRIPSGTISWSGGSNQTRYERLEKIYIRQLGIQQANNWFTNLTGLRSVYIEPDEMTGRTAFNNMFQGCVVLEEAPFFDTSSGLNFSAMFDSCANLKVVPSYNLASSTNVSNMFNGCVSLTQTPAFTLGNTASSMFNNASSLTTVGALTTTNVVDMSSMFFACGALESVPLFDTSKVTNFTSMFHNCKTLESIPLFNTILGQNFTTMFANCNALREIPLLNTIAATNMTSMFISCTLLIYLPALNTSNVTTLTSTFNGCTNLRELPALNIPVCTVFTSWLASNTSLSKSNITNATRSHSYTGNSLSQASIVIIFNNLGTAIAGQTITVSSNPGYAGLTASERLIATGKGWTIA